MKSAYELAMERLNKTSPTVKLTGAQKEQMAELDSVYAAKLAQREIAIKGEITTAQEKGDFEEADKLKDQLVFERKKLQGELEEKKDEVRSGRK